MTTPDFYIRQGDDAVLRDVLLDAAGEPVDITGAGITLELVPLKGGEPLVDDDASNDQNGDGADGSKGRVSFELDASLTADVAGDFLGQWRATFGTDVQTYPNSGYLHVLITPDPPQAAGRYLTREELKKTLNLTGQTYADDAIDFSIAAASEALEVEYGGPWSSGEPGEARYFTPIHGLTTIDIGSLTEATEVALDEAGGGAYDAILVEGTDYALEPAGPGPWHRLRLLRAGSAWAWEYDPRLNPYPWGRDALRITGTFGYPTAPAGVKVATTIVATRMLTRARSAAFGIVGLGLEGAAVRAGQIARDPEVVYAMKAAEKSRRLLV